MTSKDRTYYEQRAAAERALAGSAACDEARRAHSALADLYRARLDVPPHGS